MSGSSTTFKIHKAHVVGYSMGGMITVKLLTRHPDRVQSAVLGGMGWLREGSLLQYFLDAGPGATTGGDSRRLCSQSGRARGDRE